MDREHMLATVEAAYKARRSGDFSTLEAVVAPDAAFSYTGEQSLMAALPGAGSGSVQQAARDIFAAIEMRSLERVEAVAEDNRVAILWKTILVPPSGEPFETLMVDLWEFGEDGKIASGTQFLDTAKLVAEMR